jgi:hypothetical protein
MKTTTPRKRQVDLLVEASLEEINASIIRNGPVVCDLAEMNALKEAMKARIRSQPVLTFEPETIASDRELAGGLAVAKEHLGRLRGRRDVLVTRLLSAREQTAQVPAPRKSLAGIIAAAIGVFTLCFGPTIAGVFFSGLEDHLLAWAVSAVIAAAVGGFLTLMLLNFDEEE